MAGGIGDFSVRAEKDDGNKPGARRASAPGELPTSRGIPSGARTHYIVLVPSGWDQDAPIAFNNGVTEALKSRFRVTAKVPLPDMPTFFPSGAEGEMSFQGKDIIRLGSALREQPLFAHLEALKALVQKVAGRKLAFPEFIAGLNGIAIPPAWRAEIVNGLFEHAQTSAPQPDAPKGALSEDLDKLMGLLSDGSAGGGSKLSPSLGRVLDEVGRDSTGFILRDANAKELEQDLAKTLVTLRGSLIRHEALAEALGFLASLHKLTRAARGRDGQTVHLWSAIPADPETELVGKQAGDIQDVAVAVVLLDAWNNPARLKAALALAERLSAPLLLQGPGEEIPADADATTLLSDSPWAAHAYVFAGGVASNVDEEGVVFRPAALAFLEGLVAVREPVDFYRHIGMVLEDQDLAGDKGPARSTDRLLDMAQLDAIVARRVNRVNGARNRTTASFPLLVPWRGE